MAAIHFDSQSVKKQAKLLEEAADQIQEQNTDLASGAASLREIAAVLRDACSSMEKAEAQAKAVVSRR